MASQGDHSESQHPGVFVNVYHYYGVFITNGIKEALSKCSSPCLPPQVKLCSAVEVRDEGRFHIVSINVGQGDLGLFSLVPASCFFFFFLSLFIYFERDRNSMSWGDAKREGERERIPSRLWAVSTYPNAGLELHKTMRS